MSLTKPALRNPLDLTGDIGEGVSTWRIEEKRKGNLLSKYIVNT